MSEPKSMGEYLALPEAERSEPLLAELFSDLQRIDETSILPDGDWVSVCVATWAAEWVKRLKDAGLITATAAGQTPAAQEKRHE